jgi:DNA repair protein RadC
MSSPSESAPTVARRLQDAGPRALFDAEVLQLACGLRPGEAEAVIAEFGSLPEALAADRSALERLLSPGRAARLGLARDLVRRVLEAPLRERPMMPGWSAVADYLRAVLSGLPREQFRVLFLDRRNRLIRDEVMGEGTVDHVPVYPREVLRRALELNCSAVVLAHNHPGGDPAPSPADVDATRLVIDAGRALRVNVHDHFLVAGERVASFRAMGLL